MLSVGRFVMESSSMTPDWLRLPTWRGAKQSFAAISQTRPLKKSLIENVAVLDKNLQQSSKGGRFHRRPRLVPEEAMTLPGQRSQDFNRPKDLTNFPTVGIELAG